MIQIALDMLLPLLLLMGWKESEARAVYIAHPPVYVYQQPAGYGAFDSVNGTILLAGGWLGTTVDHEFQHARYYMIWGSQTDAKIKEDFLAARGKAYCIDKTIREQPNDWAHWPHFVINCVSRKKQLLPKEINDRYYVWLVDPPTVRRTYIPISTRS